MGIYVPYRLSPNWKDHHDPPALLVGSPVAVVCSAGLSGLEHPLVANSQWFERLGLGGHCMD